MTKIRNFKVSLRENLIYRAALKQLGIPAEDSSSSRALYEGLLSKMRAKLSPGTLFDTFPIAKIKGLLSSACGAEAPANTVATSLVIASLGQPAEEIFSAEGGSASGGEESGNASPQEIFLSEMAEDALEQSARFVSRILAREAEEEECELSHALSIQSPEKIFLDKKMKGFSLSKIGVTLNPEGVWKPRFSRAYVIFWIQKKKS